MGDRGCRLMSVRYVSQPRRRSGVLVAAMSPFLSTGSGAAANPQFAGTLLASLASPFAAVGSAVFTDPSTGGGSQFTPTHYVTADASGSGNGTLGSPYTLTQACALAQPGWVVE